jgi:hypothetical protein
LGVQKQIVQQQQPSERKETNVVKLEKSSGSFRNHKSAFGFRRKIG